MGCFEKVHICIPKIWYLHTQNSISAYQVNFQTHLDFLSEVYTVQGTCNLHECFHLQHMYCTSKYLSQTACKLAIYNVTHGLVGNNCLNWTWDGKGFIMVTNVTSWASRNPIFKYQLSWNLLNAYQGLDFFIFKCGVFHIIMAFYLHLEFF